MRKPLACISKFTHCISQESYLIDPKGGIKTRGKPQYLATKLISGGKTKDLQGGKKGYKNRKRYKNTVPGQDSTMTPDIYSRINFSFIEC